MTGPEEWPPGIDPGSWPAPERYTPVGDAIGPAGVVDPAWVHDDGTLHQVRGAHNLGLLDPVDAGHVWVAQAVYRVHPETFGDGPVFLDPENMAGVVVGCWTCGTPLDGAAAGLLATPCPGRPSGGTG